MRTKDRSASARARGAAAIVLASVMLASACGGDDESGSPNAPSSTGGEDSSAATSVGITDEVIRLGTSLPQSGPASALGVVSKAYQGCVAKVNKEGGVTMADGVTRELELIVYDDGYDPSKTVENVRRLVEQDEVFAVWGTLGTEPNAAIWDYVNENEIPNPFILSGASMFGAGFLEDHPYTLGWQPAYTTEAAIYGEYVANEMPDATVAILYQNDDYGEDFVEGFGATIEGTGVSVVAEKSYEVSDPTVDQQMVDLAATGADVFLNITTPKFATQSISKLSEMDWDPLHILNSLASSPAVFEPAGVENVQGVVSATFLKDPADPQWADDNGMKQYLADVAEYASDEHPANTFMEIGWASCDTLLQVLELSEPNREAFVETMANMDLGNPLLLPGIEIKTGEGDGYMVESMQLAEFEGSGWKLLGDVISLEGATPQR